MLSQQKQIRSAIKNMSPQRAIDYVKSFGLRPTEESSIIECDVYGKSIVQLSIELSVSVETINLTRKQAYSKIMDAVRYGYGKMP